MPTQTTYADKVKPVLFRDSSALASVRCRRRWADYELLLADLRSPDSKASRLLTEDEQAGVVKERYWLFQKCVLRAEGCLGLRNQGRRAGSGAAT